MIRARADRESTRMSYPIGYDTICLQPTERFAHTEYCSHEDLIAAATGGHPEQFMERWQYDFIWSVNDGVPWDQRGRSTDMGHADFLKGGTDRRPAKPCPFTDVEQVWAFDAVREYGLPPMDELVQYYADSFEREQAAHPHQVFTGGYYKTIVSGAIQAFGWDMLLTAAADPDKFEKVLDSIYRLSLHYYTAQARGPCKVFISHDDMVWSQGPFLHPDFYRRVIFPRYRHLWSVLKQAGKKVLFCSDGTFEQFFGDIAEAGADGFIFEPMNALEPVVEAFGQTHVLVGSQVDCRTLTLGTRADIQAEVDATLRLARQCRGFMCAVGNHIPSNVPVENGLFYFDYLSRHWRR
jgi:hypothetical protein